MEDKTIKEKLNEFELEIERLTMHLIHGFLMNVREARHPWEVDIIIEHFSKRIARGVMESQQSFFIITGVDEVLNISNVDDRNCDNVG